MLLQPRNDLPSTLSLHVHSVENLFINIVYRSRFTKIIRLVLSVGIPRNPLSCLQEPAIRSCPELLEFSQHPPIICIEYPF